MVVFPSVSSVELTSATAEHFEVSKQHAMGLRRRFASMVAVEQNLLRRIRRLLPVSVDSDTPSAVVAIRRIDEFCTKYEERNTLLPFE